MRRRGILAIPLSLVLGADTVNNGILPLPGDGRWAVASSFSENCCLSQFKAAGVAEQLSQSALTMLKTALDKNR